MKIYYEINEELAKRRGFKWSPKNSVWQRQLTDNALLAVKHIISDFDKLED